MLLLTYRYRSLLYFKHLHPWVSTNIQFLLLFNFKDTSSSQFVASLADANGKVPTGDLLNAFSTWVAQNAADVPYDHAMLFTALVHHTCASKSVKRNLM